MLDCVQSKTLTYYMLCMFVNYSYGQYKRLREAIDKNEGGLEVFSRGYKKFGFTRRYYWIPILGC